MMRHDLSNQLYAATQRLPASVRRTTERQTSAALSEASTAEDFRAVARDRKCSVASRARALWMLRLLQDRDVRGKLAILLMERPNNPLFQWEVAKTIVALRPPRIAVTVHRMLREKASSSREIAAWLLGFVGGNASNALLETVLAEDEDAAVRAQESLAEISDTAALAALHTRRNDRANVNATTVGSEVRRAIRKLKTPES